MLTGTRQEQQFFRGYLSIEIHRLEERSAQPKSRRDRIEARSGMWAKIQSLLASIQWTKLRERFSPS